MNYSFSDSDRKHVSGTPPKGMKSSSAGKGFKSCRMFLILSQKNLQYACGSSRKAMLVGRTGVEELSISWLDTAWSSHGSGCGGASARWLEAAVCW